MDIEDFVKIGKEEKLCPYYHQTNRVSEADIVFMPYNYLIDRSTQRNFGIRLDHSIVIIDEAHNIKDAAESTQSFELSLTSIILCF